MRFLADMGVSFRVAAWLRSQGHDVSHLSELGLATLANGKIFEMATAERRAVLTFDLDFGEILAQSKGRLTSVVLFRLNNTTTPHVIERLTVAIHEAQNALLEGAIVLVEDARIRVRRLPMTR